MEKVAIIYEIKYNDEKDKPNQIFNTIGIMIIDEIELGYIKPKVTFFVRNDSAFSKKQLSTVLSGLKDKVVDISSLYFELEKWVYNGHQLPRYEITTPIPIISKNKNKSSRNKNMMKELGIKHYERITLNHVGKKIT